MSALLIVWTALIGPSSRSTRSMQRSKSGDASIHPRHARTARARRQSAGISERPIRTRRVGSDSTNAAACIAANIISP